MAKILPVVAAALIDRDGLVLLAQRPEGKPLAGLWEFPGGKIGEGESPEAGLVRELREELGIETQSACLAPLGFSTPEYSADVADTGTATGNLEGVYLLLLLFVCRKWQGVPTGLEGQKLNWVKPRDLLTYKMPAADRPLAAQVRDLLCMR